MQVTLPSHVIIYSMCRGGDEIDDYCSKKGDNVLCICFNLAALVQKPCPYASPNCCKLTNLPVDDIMPSLMLCGRFHDADHKQDRSRSSNKKIKSKSIEQHPNPYSGSGLDKFAAVMAGVEAKKDKIMSEMKKSTSHSEAPVLRSWCQ